MAGKYQQFRGKVEAFQEEPAYQERINEYKKEYLGTEDFKSQAVYANVKAIAKDFAASKIEKDKIEDKLSAVNLRLAALSQLLRDILEATGTEKVELKSGAKVRLQDAPYPSVEDREQMMGWVHEEHLENLLSLHHQTLKSIVSERLLAGLTPPPGVKVWMKTDARVDFPRSKEVS